MSPGKWDLKFKVFRVLHWKASRYTRRHKCLRMAGTACWRARLGSVTEPRPQGADAQSVYAPRIEGYRSGRLSEEQVRRLLRFESRFDVHAFLKAHGVYLNYTQEDLEQDLVRR